jgi:hypothetical protein
MRPTLSFIKNRANKNGLSRIGLRLVWRRADISFITPLLDNNYIRIVFDQFIQNFLGPVKPSSAVDRVIRQIS